MTPIKKRDVRASLKEIRLTLFVTEQQVAVRRDDDPRSAWDGVRRQLDRIANLANVLNVQLGTKEE